MVNTTVIVRSKVFISPHQRARPMRSTNGPIWCRTGVSPAIRLKAPVSWSFKQYYRLFLLIKLFSKKYSKNKLPVKLVSFRLAPQKKHLQKVRMGKGSGSYVGYSWRGAVGDPVLSLSFINPKYALKLYALLNSLAGGTFFLLSGFFFKRYFRNFQKGATQLGGL